MNAASHWQCYHVHTDHKGWPGFSGRFMDCGAHEGPVQSLSLWSYTSAFTVEHAAMTVDAHAGFHSLSPTLTYQRLHITRGRSSFKLCVLCRLHVCNSMRFKR